MGHYHENEWKAELTNGAELSALPHDKVYRTR